MKKRLAAIAAVVIVLAGCAGFIQAPASAPLCPAGDTNVYIDQGSVARCRVRYYQRYVVKMPRTQGSDAALSTVCLQSWGAASVVTNNSGPYVFCVYQKGRLV